MRSIRIEIERGIVGACGNRALESQPLIVEFFQQDPAGTGLFFTDLFENFRLRETGQIGSEDFEFPIALQLGIAIFGQFFFLLLPQQFCLPGSAAAAAAPALLTARSY